MAKSRSQIERIVSTTTRDQQKVCVNYLYYYTIDKRITVFKNKKNVKKSTFRTGQRKDA